MISSSSFLKRLIASLASFLTPQLAAVNECILEKMQSSVP
jgi:hypothetical protein